MPDFGRHLISVTLCLAVAACGHTGSKRSDTPVTADSSIAPGHGDWFCQANAAWDDWDCSQDSRLAINPLPTPLPKPPQPPPVPAVMEQGSAVAATAPDPLQVDTDPVTTNVAAVGMWTTAAASPPGATPFSGHSQQAAEEPDWRHLAYRPAAVTPLNKLPAQFYTVQIVALSSMEALESFRIAHRLSGVLGARVEAGGEIYYTLLLGVYENLTDAKAAAASRPASLQHMEPWIRKLGPLQDAVVRADVLANSGGN